MAAQSSSFITDVEAAVLAEIKAKCGTGSETYPEPAYLLLAFADRGDVAPRLELDEAKLPGLLMQYVSGERTEGGIGRSANVERWNIGAVIRLTPAIMGYDGTDVSTFKGYAQASADTLSRRLRQTLDGFRPGVSDATFGELSGRGRVPRWTVVLVPEGDLSVIATVFLEWELQTEINA